MQPNPTVLERMKRRITQLLGQLGEANSEVERLENEKKAKQKAIKEARDKELAAVGAEYDPLIAQAKKRHDAVKDKLLELVPAQLQWFYKPRTTTGHFDTGEIQYTVGQPSMVIDDETALRTDLRKRKKYLKFTKDVERPLNTSALKDALLKGARDVRNLRGVRITRTPTYTFRSGKTAPTSSLSVEAPTSDTLKED